MSHLDWPGLMRAGLHGLRLDPARFWALTPAELALLLGQGGAQAPMARSGLDRLMRDFPDPMKGSQDD
jgi:uncharacterized phage protein (TIGR02216 family)